MNRTFPWLGTAAIIDRLLRQVGTLTMGARPGGA